MADSDRGNLGQNTGGEQRRLTELTVTARLMQLDAGLYCVVMTPSAAADAMTGLPGVRLTVAPGPAGRPDAVDIRTIAPDGWLSGFGDAALVRVSGGPAFVLVTVYQSPLAAPDTAPSLKILPLLGDTPPGRPMPAPGPAPAPAPASASAARPVDIIAHIQSLGDGGACFGEWLGVAGSGRWIEGFAITPRAEVALLDIEYQAVLGKDWVSPWVEGGQFCGSRGMALPLLGLRVRLRGAAAQAFTLRLTVGFVDGTCIGPVAGGEECQSEQLSPVEAILIELLPIEASAEMNQAGAMGRKPGPRRKPSGRSG